MAPLFLSRLILNMGLHRSLNCSCLVRLALSNDTTLFKAAFESPNVLDESNGLNSDVDIMNYKCSWTVATSLKFTQLQ